MEESTKLEDLHKAINAFIDEYEYYFFSDRKQKLKPEIDRFIRELDSLSEVINESKKQQRARVFLLKARLLDMLPQYEKSAEDFLNKSIKLNPVDGECWNTLGHVLWKKKDLEGSRKAFEMAIENCGKNKVSLRYQSLLLRSMGTNQQRKNNVKDSVDLAKQALMLDLKDGQSWYLVGNAWLSNFFVNFKKLSELETAIKAYNEAEKYLKYANPDLHLNRGAAYKYTEDYEQAIKDFQRANEIDATQQAQQNIKQIHDKIERCRQFMNESKQIKPKKLSTMIKSIPVETPNKKILPLKGLKTGLNKGVYFAGKVVNTLSKKGDVPVSFIVVDSAGEFSCLSLYNINNAVYEQVSQGADIVVAEPMLKPIKCGDFSYNCIQVFELNKLLVNDSSMVDKFTPNVLVNETFEK